MTTKRQSGGAVTVRRQCSRPSDGECVCGARVAVNRVALWEAINSYARACGGDPSKHVYGNAHRMEAVCRVERVVSARSPTEEEDGKKS